MKRKKFAIKTLGCKVNQYEEQVLKESLLESGFQETSPLEADIVIINSCSVTEQADTKTRKLVRRVKKDNPGVKIFVTGCYAVLEEDIKKLEALPEVYKVVPGRDKMKLPLTLRLFTDRSKIDKGITEQISSFSGHTRAFLKIQDGCDQSCSYCKVNLVRGPSRCRDKQGAMEELARLIAAGYKEIVLTGICLGSWRSSTGENLADLLKEMDQLEGNFRIRLSSIEPNHIDDSLIETIALSRKICRHLHIPLQSGSDKILKEMCRRYTARQFKNLVKKIRKKMPLIGLTMDVIVGFPGESEADFGRTLQFVKEIKPSRLHVFKYSDREGTRSFKMNGKVSPHVAKNRAEKMIERGAHLQAEFYDKFVARGVEILVESTLRDGLREGYTGEYIRVKLDGPRELEGNIICAKASDVDRKVPCLIVKKNDIQGKYLSETTRGMAYC